MYVSQSLRYYASTVGITESPQANVPSNVSLLLHSINDIVDQNPKPGLFIVAYPGGTLDPLLEMETHDFTNTNKLFVPTKTSVSSLLILL